MNNDLIIRVFDNPILVRHCGVDSWMWPVVLSAWPSKDVAHGIPKMDKGLVWAKRSLKANAIYVVQPLSTLPSEYYM